jgi:hypothetical protein
MRRTAILGILVVCAALIPLAKAQTQKPLTNADIVNLSKQGLDASLIVKEIQASSTSFDVSPEALIQLKNEGVAQSVMEAMLTAQANKPSASVEAVHGAANLTDGSSGGTGKTPCNANGECLLREGTQVPLKFANELSSKTANQGDPVEFVLDEEMKVGGTVVVPKGAHAVAVVSAAKKAGMMGKPGDLSVQLEYLNAGSNHIRLRGTQGKEGEGKVGTTVALTVLFGPIGLIKHGKNVDIAAGTPLVAYVDQDIWLSAMK